MDHTILEIDVCVLFAPFAEYDTFYSRIGVTAVNLGLLYIDFNLQS